METIPEIHLTNQIHQLSQGRYIFYDGTIDGESCYCMVDKNNNARKVIIDKSDAVLERIKKIRGIHCRRNGKYGVEAGGREIAFLGYLSGQYTDDKSRQSVQYIRIKKDCPTTDGVLVLDWRSQNMECRYKKEFEISVLRRPKEPDEKYISLTYGGVTEIFNYTDKVYNWLTGGGLYLSIGGKTKSNPGRLKTAGTFLSKAVYELLNGEIASGYECAHVHSGYRWLNSLYNLMPMQMVTNQSMSDFASQIGGVVKMNAIAWNYPYGNYKILVELRLLTLPPIYVVCDTPELYSDLQKQIMGKTKLTRNLKLFWNGEKVNTPKEEYAKIKKKENHLDDKVRCLWEWCDIRDRILAEYTNSPERFIRWTGDINDIIRENIASFSA